MIETFLMMSAAHYLADYPLQGDFVARMKGQPNADGIHTLIAHAAIQGLVVGLAAQYRGMSWLAVFVAIGVTHWCIDYGKARLGWYGLHVDQELHMAVIASLVVGTWLVGGA